jgi:hypothetical protein
MWTYKVMTLYEHNEHNACRSVQTSCLQEFVKLQFTLQKMVQVQVQSVLLL